MSALRFQLRFWDGSVEVRKKLSSTQGRRVMLVGVEGGQESRASPHDAGARVGMAVDPALMALRQPECPLQVEVVQRQMWIVTPGEESWGEGSHESRHVLVDRVLRRLELNRECIKRRLSVGARETRQGHRDGVDASVA